MFLLYKKAVNYMISLCSTNSGKQNKLAWVDRLWRLCIMLPYQMQKYATYGTGMGVSGRVLAPHIEVQCMTLD